MARIDSRRPEAVGTAQTNSLGGNRGGNPRGSHLKTADDLFDSQTGRMTESTVLSLRFSRPPDITSVTGYSSTELTTI